MVTAAGEGRGGEGRVLVGGEVCWAYCARLLRASSALTSMSELLKSTMTTPKLVSPVISWIWEGKRAAQEILMGSVSVVCVCECVCVRVCVCVCVLTNLFHVPNEVLHPHPKVLG